jgi:hypothetical protein
MRNLTIFPNRRATLVFALFILLLGALNVYARDINVEGDCSLRDAIEAANENKKKDGCVAGSGPSDTIILKSHVNVGRPLPEITTDIVISGNGRMLTFGDYPAFVVDDASLTLGHLHVRFRRLRTDRLLKISDGTLTLDNTVFHDCNGGMSADDSSIKLLGNSIVCGHPRDTIQAWFGMYPPAPSTCEALTGATVTLNPGSGAECQKVGAAGIGNQSLVDGGFIDAVDIWSYVGPGVQICFPHIGSLVFLDAATAPRAASTLQSYSSGGMTCASVDRPGTVVLMPGQPTGAAPPAAEPAPAPAVSAPAPAASQPVVEGCPIHTTGHLKLRAQPSLNAEVLGYVLRGSTLGALGRTTYWFQVSYQGQTGWIGSRYVSNVGNC